MQHAGRDATLKILIGYDESKSQLPKRCAARFPLYFSEELTAEVALVMLFLVYAPDSAMTLLFR